MRDRPACTLRSTEALREDGLTLAADLPHVHAVNPMGTLFGEGVRGYIANGVATTRAPLKRVAGGRPGRVGLLHTTVLFEAEGPIIEQPETEAPPIITAG